MFFLFASLFLLSPSPPVDPSYGINTCPRSKEYRNIREDCEKVLRQRPPETAACWAVDFAWRFVYAHVCVDGCAGDVVSFLYKSGIVLRCNSTTIPPWLAVFVYTSPASVSTDPVYFCLWLCHFSLQTCRMSHLLDPGFPVFLSCR